MRRLVIPGNPVSKGRPRCGKRGAYTPQKTRDAEELIGWCWKDVHGAIPVSGLVRVYLTFMEGTKQRAQDIDNLVKLVLDALNGIAWEDDRQVVAVHAELFRGRPDPQTRIIVEEVTDGQKTPQQWMADPKYRGIVVVKPRPPQEESPFLVWWNTPITDEAFFAWLCGSHVESRGYVQGAGYVQHPLPEEE